MTTTNEIQIESMSQAASPPAMPVLTRPIDMRTLRQLLDEVRVEVENNDTNKPLPVVVSGLHEGDTIECLAGIISTTDGTTVATSKNAADRYHGVTTWLVFSAAFMVAANKARLFDSPVELDVFQKHIASRTFPKFSGQRGSWISIEQLVDHCIDVAGDMNDLVFDSLGKKSGAGDAEAKYLLHRFLNDKSNRQYDPESARKLLWEAAYLAHPEACRACLKHDVKDKASTKLLSHLCALGENGNETAHFLWAEHIVDRPLQADTEKSRPNNSACRSEAIRVLQAASRKGNPDATWLLFRINQRTICWSDEISTTETREMARLLRLAGKQEVVAAMALLAESMMIGTAEQPRDLRKAHKTFLKLCRMTRGMMPPRPGPGYYYLWAYVCLEIGVRFPKELAQGLAIWRDENKEDSHEWSCALIHALLDYKKLGRAAGFRDVIFQVDEDWISVEGELDDNFEPLVDFFQGGDMNIGRSLRDYGGPADSKKWNSLEFPQTLTALRNIANKDVHEAQYILGLLGDTTDDWLGRASDGGFSLASYHLGFTRYAKEPEAALRHLKWVAYQTEENLKDFPEKFEIQLKEYDDTKEIVPKEFFNEIRNRALSRINEIERQLAEQRTREQTQRDMLSYLTHTLNNTFAGRPEAARQALEILGDEAYENNAGYKAISNIASMLSTFLFAQQLINTFKLYVADPDALRKNWDADREGDETMTAVLAASLRQTLSQVVFSSSHLAALKRLLPQREGNAIKNIRKSFMSEMLPLDVGDGNARTVLDWIRDHMGMIEVSIDPAAELHFHSNSTRYTFFFSSFSELIFNALKYSDAKTPIKVNWVKTDNTHVFRCENSWSEDLRTDQAGSGKGLVFIERMAQMLGATVVKQVTEDRFVAEIRFPENLLKGEA